MDVVVNDEVIDLGGASNCDNVDIACPLTCGPYWGGGVGEQLSMLSFRVHWYSGTLLSPSKMVHSWFWNVV